MLTPEERDIAYAWIIANIPWGVGIADASVIEEHGILAANQQAMRSALADLRTKAEPRELLIDGRDAFTFPLPHRSIIRGDGSEPSIAAASIVAKVTRDRWMIAAHETYPLYGFAGHKGYGSEDHRRAIREHGPCVIHRLSFLGNTLQTALIP